jgi:hypothetical protein
VFVVFFCLRSVLVSLDCPFSIAPLVFSNVHNLLELFDVYFTFSWFAWFCFINCLHLQNIVDHKYHILHSNYIHVLVLGL